MTSPTDTDVDVLEGEEPTLSEVKDLGLGSDPEAIALPIDTFASPAAYENTKFKCEDSVEFWMNLNRDGKMGSSDMLQEVTKVANSFVSKGGDALYYWLRHNARTGYFVTNAALGTVGSTLHERLRGLDQPDSGTGFVETLTKPEVISRMLMEVSLSYEQDYKCIADGTYKPPYDMYTSNRQQNPLYFGQQTAKFINEAIGTLTRRNRGSQEDKDTWLTTDDSVESKIYPDYYKTAFHYQTDGWMSRESADVYETSTETLFLGRQDAMQRTALIPLMRYAKEFKNNLGRPLKVLEVACGTGRFLTFARDNLPLDTEFTAVDLSPFYLEKARDNDRNWRSIRKRQDSSSDGYTDAIDIDIAPARFVQAKAEDLPFADEEFDIVVCMYLYHEIPRDIRAEVSREMARVTKCGGRVILTDSYQLGDRPVMDKTMGNFERMNEPHYRDYIEDFLPLHFEDAGLECLTKSFRSSTKTLAFGKPLSE